MNRITTPSSQQIVSPSRDRTTTAPKKQPRTVHIDVYCTGSEDEEEDGDAANEGDDSSSASSSGDDNNVHELESNTTHQTVIDSNQMRLQHQRVDSSRDQLLPRRLMRFQSPAANIVTTTKPFSTKEDVAESKQLLFNKCIGATTISGTSNSTKHPFIRQQKFAYHKDPSDDCLSTTYPNSSHSTMRDLTCSSISSAIASGSAINEDLDGSSTFWYDNDIKPIKKSELQQQQPMESMWTMTPQWRSPEKERKLLLKQQKISSSDKYYLDEELEQFDSNESNVSIRELNDDRLSSPIAKQSSSSVVQQKFTHHLHVTPAQPTSDIDEIYLVQRRNNMPTIVPSSTNRILFSQLSLTQSTNSVGVASINDHWTRAKKFGDVIRRIGHHFGPVRNPDCQCSHCRRWMIEREQGRKRASSVGDVSPFIYRNGIGSRDGGLWMHRHQRRDL